MVVASIETVWDGPRSPYRERVVTEHDRTFEKGDEVGRFLLGSSVVLAFEAGGVRLDPSLAAGTVVRMGASIGTSGLDSSTASGAPPDHLVGDLDVDESRSTAIWHDSRG